MELIWFVLALLVVDLAAILFGVDTRPGFRRSPRPGARPEPRPGAGAGIAWTRRSVGG